MPTEFSRLCRYYLECIGQDMDEGVSVFARNQSGDPQYAQLAAASTESHADWWSSSAVPRLLGQMRADRAKLTAWLGYPVRLRHHRTERWQGFFVEPVFLWPVLLPERAGDAPRIDEQNPTLNSKFMRSVARCTVWLQSG